jgi:hypothetical protein
MARYSREGRQGVAGVEVLTVGAASDSGLEFAHAGGGIGTDDSVGDQDEPVIKVGRRGPQAGRAWDPSRSRGVLRCEPFWLFNVAQIDGQPPEVLARCTAEAMSSSSFALVERTLRLLCGCGAPLWTWTCGAWSRTGPWRCLRRANACFARDGSRPLRTECCAMPARGSPIGV